MDRLDRLAGAIDRRGVALAGAYSLAALAVPDRSHTTGAAPTARDRAHPPVGMSQVRTARALLALFSEHDAAFGAGPVRESLRQYLASTVVPWLRSDSAPAVRRDLFTVAGQLTYLCAFTHFDANRNGRAQQYYLIGIALAGEAGDPIGYALGLRGLSVQAHALGHYAEADRLAEQAVETGLRQAPAHLQAFLLGQRAVTRACLGQRRAAASALVAAERSLDRATSGPTPVGAYHPGSLALQHAAAARGMGDHAAAVTALHTSLRHRPADERRSQAISLAELAETQLALGHLDQACDSWSSFLELYPRIRSARADDRLRILRARLRPHTGNRAAAALYERAGRLRADARSADARPLG